MENGAQDSKCLALFDLRPCPLVPSLALQIILPQKQVGRRLVLCTLC